MADLESMCGLRPQTSSILVEFNSTPREEMKFSLALLAAALSVIALPTPDTSSIAASDNSSLRTTNGAVPDGTGEHGGDIGL